MAIREYIREQVFSRRAIEHGALVIYDPTRKYRDIVLEMVSEHCIVIDAAQSVIEQREAATEALTALAEGAIHQLVILIPASAPEDNDAKQSDPFSVFAEIGKVFPQGDGDDYASICRRAKPDHVSEINRLFEEGEPSFDMIDALDQGGSWPKLKTLLGVTSAKEIVLGVMSPKTHQEDALKNDPSWVAEANEFLQRSLGHKLKTKGQTRQSIAEELWKVMLFSEFVFDSAGDIPLTLETIPHAGFEAKSLVYDVCDELRKHEDHKDAYRITAQEIEQDLALAERSQGMTQLGVRDTFSFEERYFLQFMVDRALEGDLDKAREIWESRKKSIWMGLEERLAEWSLASRALDLLDAADRLSTPKFPSLESIVHGYALNWRDLDRHHREMEQAVNQWQGDHDGLESLVDCARSHYYRSVEALQSEFIRLVMTEGWPVSGGQILWNNQIFSKLISPALDSGERVAYFLVDSLRYELGVEIEKQLSDKRQVTLHTVCAQLPTYTEVGMASLMPEAESQLKLVAKDGKLVTFLGDKVATAPATRFSYLQSRKGDQCGDIDLDNLIHQKKPKIAEKVRLLVVRTRDIDNIAHDTPHHVLQMIPTLVRQIIRGLTKVAEMGFDKAVIATDHGFILFHEQGAGNLAPRPSGTWLIEKTRCMLGKGQPDSSNLVMKGRDLGIPGEFDDFAAPKTLVPYTRGQMYYHEGLSLQECVLPCLTVQLEPSDKRIKKSAPENLMLSYRQGKSDRISSRRPVLDLAWPQAGFFADEGEIEVVLEATDSTGKVIGWVGSCSTVNPATGGVRIKPGAAISVGLRMEDDFSGSFTVRVLDAVTNALLANINLKTGYLE